MRARSVAARHAGDNRRTKIVATIGPASRSPARLAALVHAGVDVVRLNMSHGTQAEHGEVIARVGRAVARAGRPVAILLDLAGPKIRTGTLAGGRPIRLVAGARLILTPQTIAGDEHRLSVTHRGLARDVAPGARVLVDDGRLALRVRRVRGREVECEVVAGGLLGEHKGVNLPDTEVAVPALTAKDRADLRFGLARGVDFVALSFVRRPADLAAVRREMARAGAGAGTGAAVPVIAKLEKPQAIARLDDILDVADGVMVARGDLGVEMPAEDVPVLQKAIIRRANAARVPVITATQMLESMVESVRPTRAEASDVANAIYDGTDAVMLSEETAVGRYPVEAVRMMARIAERAEEGMLGAGAGGGTAVCSVPPVVRLAASHPRAVAAAVVAIAREAGASAIVVFTLSGATAGLVAKERPPMPVVAITPDP